MPDENEKHHLPYFQFYPADWIQDVRILSLEAQGAWMAILCALHTAPERGRHTWNIRQLQQLLGFPEGTITNDNEGYPRHDKAISLIAELRGVADISWLDVDGNECDDLSDAFEITIISRRMVRDEMQRLAILQYKRDWEKAHPGRKARKYISRLPKKPPQLHSLAEPINSRQNSDKFPKISDARIQNSEVRIQSLNPPLNPPLVNKSRRRNPDPEKTLAKKLISDTEIKDPLEQALENLRKP